MHNDERILENNLIISYKIKYKPKAPTATINNNFTSVYSLKKNTTMSVRRQHGEKCKLTHSFFFSFSFFPELGTEPKMDSLLSPCTKLKSKWIKDLHIKPDTLKLIKEKVRKSLEHIGPGENFLNRTPMAYAVTSGIDKWDLIKCKASVRQRTLLIGQNGNQQIGKRSLPILHLIKD